MQKPALHTKQSAATHLGVSVRYIEVLIGRGELPSLKIGRLRRIRQEALDAFVKRVSTAA